ncbi:hypothetical protein PR048_016682 [Dryococelus australis]|uniref:Uncharacterized protein n=1 Tax=Dryococelus australis TaxID=614101 RepID=A0ABQ9H7D7_9NEOP|nr:hypothetical protein PR048_016682 [Dryococelus australis]
MEVLGAEVGIEERRNGRAVEMKDPRENQLISFIVRHYSRLQSSPRLLINEAGPSGLPSPLASPIAAASPRDRYSERALDWSSDSDIKGWPSSRLSGVRTIGRLEAGQTQIQMPHECSESQAMFNVGRYKDVRSRGAVYAQRYRDDCATFHRRSLYRCNLHGRQCDQAVTWWTNFLKVKVYTSRTSRRGLQDVSGRRVDVRQPPTKKITDLRSSLREERNQLPRKLLNRLVESMSWRAACVAIRDEAVKVTYTWNVIDFSPTASLRIPSYELNASRRKIHNRPTGNLLPSPANRRPYGTCSSQPDTRKVPRASRSQTEERTLFDFRRVSLSDIRIVVIVPDDAAGQRVFSGISCFPRLLHSGAAPYSSRWQEPSESLHSSFFPSWCNNFLCGGAIGEGRSQVHCSLKSVQEVGGVVGRTGGVVQGRSVSRRAVSCCPPDLEIATNSFVLLQSWHLPRRDSAKLQSAADVWRRATVLAWVWMCSHVLQSPANDAATGRLSSISTRGRAPLRTLNPTVADLICTVQDHDGNTARLARRSDEALALRVSVARIAPSHLDLGRAGAHTLLLKADCEIPPIGRVTI